MEFKFDVNVLLPDTITKVDKRLMPSGAERYWSQKEALQIEVIINEIGLNSAKAQNLQHPITTARKLQNSDHFLYIMKDAKASSGQGAVVGILKVGRKQLFLTDLKGEIHKLTPMCVLDFYVHESRQRSGLGKLLFEHMLKAEKLEPQLMAIDRPSDKLLAFLEKHYALCESLPQGNNFTIFPELLPKTHVLDEELFPSGRPKSGRRSEPVQQSAYFNTNKPNRLSYPPCSRTGSANNSVAAVVFGNTEVKRVVQSEVDKHLPHRQESTQDLLYPVQTTTASSLMEDIPSIDKTFKTLQLSSGTYRMCPDSSLNIFGVPSRLTGTLSSFSSKEHVQGITFPSETHNRPSSVPRLW